MPAVLAHLKGAADELGLPFGPRNMTFNSRKAAELGKWAEEQGRGHEFHMAAFKAYFVHGLNIANMEVLRSLAELSGLDPDQAELAVKERTYRAAVDQDWMESRNRGVTAVPTFFCQGRRLVGHQPYHLLEKLVTTIS